MLLINLLDLNFLLICDIRSMCHACRATYMCQTTTAYPIVHVLDSTILIKEWAVLRLLALPLLHVPLGVRRQLLDHLVEHLPQVSN